MKRRSAYKILLISVLAAAVFCSIFIMSAFVDRAFHWRTQLNALREASSNNTTPGENIARIMMIGDSIVKNFPTRSFFHQGLILINLGVSGNSIEQIYKRYATEHQKNYYDIVIFQGGINDIHSCVRLGGQFIETNNKIKDCYIKLVSIAKENGKKIIICSILPVTSKFLFASLEFLKLPTGIDINLMNQYIKSTNADLKKIADETGSIFCDIYALSVDKIGEFNRHYSEPDGLHVNILGYGVISKEIEKCVNSLLTIEHSSMCLSAYTKIKYIFSFSTTVGMAQTDDAVDATLDSVTSSSTIVSPSSIIF